MGRSKVIITIVGLVALAWVCTYLAQRQRIHVLEAEHESLLAQQVQANAERDAADRKAQAAQMGTKLLRSETAELLRLRNEVSQLRRERDAQAQRASQPLSAATPAAQTANGQGQYISKEQLAFVGYATPDAALQSMTWAMMNGTYEQANAGLGPDLLKHELADAKGREQFEAGRTMMAPLFKGMQIVGRKTLADDRVELKVKMDADPLPGAPAEMPPFMIQPMVKIGNEWKLAGSTRGYEPQWDDGTQTP